MTNQAARLKALFHGRESAHGEMRFNPDGSKWVDAEDEKDAKTKRPGSTNQQYGAHLRGDKIGVGEIPLREDGTCLFAALDVDNHDTPGVDVGHADLARHVQEAGPTCFCSWRSRSTRVS